MPELPGTKGFGRTFDPVYLKSKADKLDLFVRELVNLFQPDTSRPLREFLQTQARVATVPSSSFGGSNQSSAAVMRRRKSSAHRRASAGSGGK